MAWLPIAPASTASSAGALLAAPPAAERLVRSSPGDRPQVAIPDVAARTVPRLGPGARVVPRLGPGGTAVFLGDSFTTGYNGAGIGSRGWPALVDRARGWRTVNLAVAGTGFVNAGWTNQPLGSRVSAAARQHPDIVFVASGHNDSRWSATTTSAAADQAIDRLRSALPDAVIVIVGPIWQDGRPPSRCLILRDHLRRKAASIGAIFIDPLAEGWFAGANHRFIGPDGLHPTDAGHRHMTARVLADLAGS